MSRSSFVRFKAISFFALAVAAVSAASCSENLAAGGACPLLCPQESAPLKDTILDAVVLDTSAIGFPALGFENVMLLAKRGDSLDSRIISRYDSLPLVYRYGESTDSAITHVDSVFILAPRPRADSAVAFTGDATVEAYDVTDAANDTAVADLAAQFTVANRLGSTAFVKGDSPDTIRVLLDTARVRDRLLNTRNLRIGLRLVTAGSEEMRITSANGAGGVALYIYASRDPAADSVRVFPGTASPADPEYLRQYLSDFTISTIGSLPSVNTLRVGGLPSHRVLFKFDIPTQIVDSSVVVRASLMLTQKPSTMPDAGTAVSVHIVPIVASSQVTDLHSQLEFAGSAQLYPVDSLVTVPKDSGNVTLEMVSLVRAWKGKDQQQTPRIAALYLSSEGSRTASFEFFSLEAAAALRPKLRITYVTRVNTGQP